MGNSSENRKRVYELDENSVLDMNTYLLIDNPLSKSSTKIKFKTLVDTIYSLFESSIEQEVTTLDGGDKKIPSVNAVSKSITKLNTTDINLLSALKDKSTVRLFNSITEFCNSNILKVDNKNKFNDPINYKTTYLPLNSLILIKDLKLILYVSKIYDTKQTYSPIQEAANLNQTVNEYIKDLIISNNPIRTSWFELSSITSLNTASSGSGSGGEFNDTAVYNTYTAGETYSGREGLLKHTILPNMTGLGKNNCPNGLITLSNRKTPVPQAKGTKGKLVTSSGQIINIPELFFFNNVSDICTETYIEQKFSKDIILKYDWLYEWRKDTSVQGVQIEFRIPLSELDGKPATVAPSEVANIIQSNFEVKTEEKLKSLTYTYMHFISFSYDGTSDYATLTLLTHQASGKGSLKKSLELAQFPFKYLLAEPRYKYNVDKVYIHSGDTVSFEVAEGYTQPKSLSLKAPGNISAAVNNISALSQDINDLNYRVENVEVSSNSNQIGSGDGSTDDTAAIQAAINSAKNMNPEYAKEVVLKPGVYRISSPLKMNINNLTLRGEGQVILWAADGYYEPIIRVLSGGCKVENITFWLAKTNNDTNYKLKGNGINRGYLKSYKEKMDDESIKYGNGHYSAIYVDVGQQFGDGEGLYGLYNFTAKDIKVQGAYRYSTKYIEKSYGIYFSGGGYCYFNKIENCHFNSVMCGLYLGSGCNPCDGDVSFDIGDDIYGLKAGGNPYSFQQKTCDDVMGLRFGAIINSPANTIHFDGQLVGEDSMNPYIYDSDGYELCLDYTNTNLTETSAFSYNSSTKEYKVIEGEKVPGFSQDIIDRLEWKKVSECGIKVNSSSNNLEGMIYDAQRAEKGCWWLTTKSKHNTIKVYASDMGYGKSINAFHRYMYIPVVTENNKFTKWTEIAFINSTIKYIDQGTYNMCHSDLTLNQENKFGSSMINSIDQYGISLFYPKNFEKVDDIAAYVDKIGSVKFYYTENDGTETPITEFYIGDPSKNITTTDYTSLFRPNNNLEYGLYTGLTFKQIPTDKNPIIIEIDFGRIINGISAIDIRFNKFIAKDIDIATPLINEEGYKYFNMAKVNANGEFLCNTLNPNGTHNAVGKTKKIRIKIGSAYQPVFSQDVYLNNNFVEIFNYKKGETYNPKGYVGISKIFVSSSNNGGNVYLPLGGGKVYGDIEPESVILKSTNSDKRFKISVNDNGEITATEIK